MIRVGLADDQALVRSGFAALLDAEDDITVVGSVADGFAAVRLAREARPDVLLMDIRMPGLDGIAATREIASVPALAGVHVVILTTFGLDEYIFDALRAGAAGFLVKDTDAAELIRAVRVIASGDSLMSPGVTRRLIAEFASRTRAAVPVPGLSELTSREREVVALVAAGLSNEEIAARIYVSQSTVKTHVARAMTKLGARDRAQLVVIAYEAALVRPGWAQVELRPRPRARLRAGAGRSTRNRPSRAFRINGVGSSHAVKAVSTVVALPGPVMSVLAGIVGEHHVLTGDAAAGFAVDWTGRFQGHAAAVLRPRDTAEVAAVLAVCTEAGVPVVPQGGNTGLVGGGVPLHGEVVLSLARLTQMSPVDREASQVTAGAGVTLQQVADADPNLDLGIAIASRESATVGGAVATNAGGVRVLRFGPMRAQLRGIEAVLSDGTIVSHLAGLTKDNTGYDYPSLLAGSEGTLAVITATRLRLVPRMADAVTVIIGLGGLDELHALALAAVRQLPGLVSAEFFTETGLDILVKHAGLAPPLPTRAPAYLLLEASGASALDDLADLIGDRDAAVAGSAADRRRLWSYRERHPEAAGFLGVPIKLDVSVPAAQWVRLASDAAGVVAEADPGATVITFGHVADGNVHINIVPAAAADGRHENAVFSFVASLGGSISAEHGIGALKAPWFGLARTDAERSLFARIRGALDPAGTLNPHVLPR